jgi:hypothetical protein
MTPTIGFTGALRGMTVEQQAVLMEIMKDIVSTSKDQAVAHHGEAAGADAQFHRMCRQLVPPGLRRKTS